MSPDDINSNQSLGGDSENVNAEGPSVDQPQNPKRQKTGGTEGRRNRASPARLFKLNKDLIFEQKGVIIEKEFGGLLDLASNSMRGDISQWIMRHYDLEMSQIVITERGKILVDAASVRRIWGLPNRRRKPKTEFSRCADYSLFGSMDHITKFVATRLPESYDKTGFIVHVYVLQKQKKLTVYEEKDNDESEEDGSSDNDDGGKVGTSVHMGREVEIDGNKGKEDEEEGKEDDDDDEGDDNEEEKEDDEGDDNEKEKEDDEQGVMMTTMEATVAQAAMVAQATTVAQAGHRPTMMMNNATAIST
ncbi:hypothetical protein D1007_35400 [Hordeum vulgare]|nr:hypothetical protein D1007_35400 [Hordeum vulgare]